MSNQKFGPAAGGGRTQIMMLMFMISNHIVAFMEMRDETVSHGFFVFFFIWTNILLYTI